MKNAFYLSILLTFLLTSCGLRYTPIETPEDNEIERRKAIETYLISTLSKDSSTYRNIAFAKSEMIKPLSFKQLDSLYGLKYNLEQQNLVDKKLEENILIQRQIVLNDTNPILFVENHLFGIEQKDDLTIYTGLFECTQNNAIRKVKISDGKSISPAYLNLYKIFLFEESILNPGFEPNSAEVTFYKKFKPKYEQLQGIEQEKFLNHTLTVMNHIQIQKSTLPINSIKQIVLEHVQNKDQLNRINDEFTTIEEEVKVENDKELLVGYNVVFRYQKIKDGLSYTFNLQYKLNEYYEILSQTQF